MTIDIFNSSLRLLHIQKAIFTVEYIVVKTKLETKHNKGGETKETNKV